LLPIPFSGAEGAVSVKTTRATLSFPSNTAFTFIASTHHILILEELSIHKHISGTNNKKIKGLKFKRLFYTSISTQNKEQEFLITKQRGKHKLQKINKDND
jgi:hypothetical protein